MSANSEQLRITVIAGFAPSLVKFRGQLLAAMVAAGHEVIACAPGDHSDVAEELRNTGVSYRSLAFDRTGISPVKDFALIVQLYRLFRQQRPDMVLNYTIKPVIYGSLAASAAGVARISSIITGLGYAFTRQSLVNRIVRRLYKVALARNQTVFFQNGDDKAEFQRLGLVRTGRPNDPSSETRDQKIVIVNGSGVDLEHYREAELQSQSAEDGGAPSRIFLLIARLLRDKGILEFVAAARALKRKYPRLSFRLVGPFDSNPAALQPREIEEWSREGAIEYLGEAEDVRPILRECNVYVLPSYREGTPRTVLEAMATGRAIVTADAPGCRETVLRKTEMLKSGNAEMRSLPAGVTRGENGFLVPVRDASKLAWAMEQFVLHPELVPEMGRKSREYAEERYDVHKVNAVILKELGLR